MSRQRSMPPLRIALGQINTVVGDLRGNTRRIVESIRRAEEAEADIVCLPELAVTGYPPEDLLLKPHFLRENRRCLDEIASSTGNIVAIVGFADGEVGEVYNAAAIISQGAVLDVYHKMFLPNYGVFDEKRYFLPGKECAAYLLGGARFGVNICEDIWYPEGPTLVQARAGAAQLILNINSSPYHRQKWRSREEMLAHRARDNGVYIAYTNLVGGQDELVFDGHSLVFAPDGHLLAQARQFADDLALVDLPVPLERVPAGQVPGLTTADPPDDNGTTGGYLTSPEMAIACRRVELPGSIRSKAQELEPPFSEPLPELEEVYQALVLGLGDYTRKNGFEKAVVGLSGGIDSALTVALAVDALGSKNVRGVSMPSTYSSPEGIEDTRRLAENLGIELSTIPIQGIFEHYLSDLGPVFAGVPPDVTEENLQARIRGNLLMALSNKFGWLVLSTGNKSETACGYATLYGDMAGGLAVIKDVTKTLVYELAHQKNRAAGREVIPRGILERAPTAELRPGQLDEDSLPPYPVLDPILLAYVEEDKSLEEIVSLGYPQEIVENVIRMVDRNEYKRRQAPPGIKITPKAFGRDRRLPIVNRFGG